MILTHTETSDVFYNFKNNSIKKSLQFGIEYLDDATRGILESDLIMLGARPGAGKTAISAMIAQHNAKEGKRVVYYALEADQDEIHERMFYREVADLYYANKENREILNYPDFVLGVFNIMLRKEKKQAMDNLRSQFDNLEIIYKKADDITPDDLATDMAFRHEFTDLFILDHAHYVDFDVKDENAGLKALTKALRNTALVYKTPVLCVAHLRKRDRFNKDIVPGIDEFHGSSDLVKVATKVITLAPYDSRELPPSQRNTIIRIGKNRLDGSVCSYAAKLIFDIRTNSYLPQVEIAHLADCDKEFIGISDINKMPYWTKNMSTLEVSDVRDNDRDSKRSYKEASLGI